MWWAHTMFRQKLEGWFWALDFWGGWCHCVTRQAAPARATQMVEMEMKSWCPSRCYSMEMEMKSWRPSRCYSS